MTGGSFALDADPGAMSTSALTGADLERLAAQRTEATAVLACNARDAADLRLLCEAAGLPLDRQAVLSARSVIRKTRAQRKARKRPKGRQR